MHNLVDMLSVQLSSCTKLRMSFSTFFIWMLVARMVGAADETPARCVMNVTKHEAWPAETETGSMHAWPWHEQPKSLACWPKQSDGAPLEECPFGDPNGAVSVIEEMKGLLLTELAKDDEAVGGKDDESKIDACRKACYTDKFCMYWQHRQDGCYRENEWHPVTYPLTRQYATLEGHDNTQVGEFVQHFCASKYPPVRAIVVGADEEGCKPHADCDGLNGLQLELKTWDVKPGDKVKEMETLGTAFSFEYRKNVSIKAPYGGTVFSIGILPGDRFFPNEQVLLIAPSKPPPTTTAPATKATESPETSTNLGTSEAISTTELVTTTQAVTTKVLTTEPITTAEVTTTKAAATTAATTKASSAVKTTTTTTTTTTTGPTTTTTTAPDIGCTPSDECVIHMPDEEIPPGMDFVLVDMLSDKGDVKEEDDVLFTYAIKAAPKPKPARRLKVAEEVPESERRLKVFETRAKINGTVTFVLTKIRGTILPPNTPVVVLKPVRKEAGFPIWLWLLLFMILLCCCLLCCFLCCFREEEKEEQKEEEKPMLPPAYIEEVAEPPPREPRFNPPAPPGRHPPNAVVAAPPPARREVEITFVDGQKGLHKVVFECHPLGIIFTKKVPIKVDDFFKCNSQAKKKGVQKGWAVAAIGKTNIQKDYDIEHVDQMLVRELRGLPVHPLEIEFRTPTQEARIVAFSTHPYGPSYFEFSKTAPFKVTNIRKGRQYADHGVEPGWQILRVAEHTVTANTSPADLQGWIVEGMKYLPHGARE